MDGIRREKKKGTRGRVLAFLLCFAMLCGQIGNIVPTFAMAAEPTSEITVELEESEQPIVDAEPVSEPESAEEAAAVTEQQTSGATEADTFEVSSVDTSATDVEDQTGAAAAVESVQTEGETVQQTQSEAAAEMVAVQTEGETVQQVQSETITLGMADETGETQEETAVSKPEFTFSADLDGMKIHIHAADGILPEGTTAEVSKLSDGTLDTAFQSIQNWSAEKNLVQLIGFEISFFDADGAELHQFDQKIEITYSGLTFAENAEEMQVFHADADGSVTEALTEVMAVASEVKFSSDQFSPILVAAYGSEEETETASDGRKAGNGIMPAALGEDQNGGISLAAIGGQDSVSIEVGQTTTVSSTVTDRQVGSSTDWLGNTTYYHESWSSSNEAVATVAGIPDGSSGDDQYKQTSATITGVSAGTATITHTYYTTSTNWFGTTSWTENTETITVTVTEIPDHTVTFDIGTDAQTAGVSVPESVTVKHGQTLSELPSLVWKNTDGEYVKIFAGWYSDESRTTEFTTSTTVTADTTLYASWVDAEAEGMYYVNFYSQDGQTVYLTLAAQEGKTVNPAGGPTEDGKVFKGWSATMQGDSPASSLNAFDFSTPVSDAVAEGSDTLNLYAWYAPSVKVSFISNGGNAVPTQFIAQGDTAENVTPTRTGYTFDGWYTDEELTQKFDFTTPVNADITLYAKWTANMVPVTLVYMYENADNDDYSAAGASEVVYAPAGSYISIEKSAITQTGQSHSVRYSDTQNGELTGYAKTTATGSTNAAISDVRDTYYQYNSATNGRLVNPDGSTVVLVYYNRARITLTFTYNLSSNGSMDVDSHISAEDQAKYNVVYTPTTKTSGGTTYNNFTYQFTAKYGQDITAVWPQVGWVTSDGTGSSTFYAWQKPTGNNQATNMYTLESDLFNGSNGLSINDDGVLVGAGSLTSQSSSTSKKWLIYARTTLPGETADFTYNGTNYTIYTEACQLLMSGGTTSYKKLDGCTATDASLETTYSTNMSMSSLTVVGGSLKDKFDGVFPNQIESGNNCKVLLYNRNSLTLSAWTNTGSGTDPQTASYLYGDWIYNEDTDLLKTLEQSMVKEGYRFAGWYTDPNFTAGTEFTLDENTRITANLNLYAKWEPSQFTAEYYLYTDDATPYATQGFAEGGKIDDKFVPAAVQSQFLGWYWYQNGVLVPFDFTSTVGAAHVDSNGVLKLYAMWEGNTGKVSYLPGIGGDNSTQEVTDSRDFEINQAAVQLPEYTSVWTDGSVPSDTSLTFVGWKAPNGKIYQPGRYVLVTRQLMQFEAQWSNDAVKLIYDANGGSGANVTETWERNSVVDIWDNMDATTPHFTREGYELIGWDENKDATEPTYKLGEGTITLSKDTTTLYAIWKQTTVTITVEKQVTGSLGDTDKLFSFSYSYQNSDETVTGTFELKDDGTATIENIPVGAVLTLTETNAAGYETSAVYETGGTIQKANNGSLTFTINETDKKIVVTNTKEVVPDTGVILDTLPYVLILAVVIVCGILFFRKRRNGRDD